MDWQVREDFDASGRADAHFVLDAQAGTLTLGDGERGRALPVGARLFASYLATRAAAGNVPAGVITRPPDRPAGVRVAQPLAAWGGRDAETLDEVEARLLDGLARPTRAVTAEDCRALALSVPGTAVARAWAAADQHPDLPGVTTPGVVSVIILPELPAKKPMPTPGLCAAVAAYLGRRGVMGTRIEVAGPLYSRVTVRAELHASVARVQGLAALARAALDRFFHPLRGGPDGTGWPIGRDVYRAEVLQALAGVAGVESVSALEMTVNDGGPLCGDVCLGPRGLPESGRHQIAVVAAPSRHRTSRVSS